MIKGFHKEGRVFLIIATIVGAISICALHAYAVHPIIYWLSISAIVIFLYLFFQFFRVPKRKLLHDDSLIYSPCDGKVVVIEEVVESEFLNEPCRQISIFMSPLNVHINWYPAAGLVKYYKYHPGKFLVAWHPKSSTENERTSVVVENPKGTYLMRQIAGAVARRIICYAKEDAIAAQNMEMGFIKFGSRVDIFIPLSAEIKVRIGDKVSGTQSVLASW